MTMQRNEHKKTETDPRLTCILVYMKPLTMTSPHHDLTTNVVSCLVTSIAVAVAPREQHQREHPKCGCERGFSLRYFQQKTQTTRLVVGAELSAATSARHWLLNV